jgi:hypothetical protein
LIGANTSASTTPLGIALTLAAALSWGAGNYVARAAGPVNMLGFVIWSSLFSAPVLLLLAFAFEGGPVLLGSLRSADAAAWAAAGWQALGNSLFGYAAWGWLLQRYSAAAVSPIALLVPVFGMSASGLLLGEPFPLWKLAAASFVMIGLGISILWPRLAAARAERFADPADLSSRNPALWSPGRPHRRHGRIPKRRFMAALALAPLVSSRRSDVAEMDPSNFATKPADMIMQMASGLWVSRAIWAACRIGVPEAIGEAAVTIRSIAQQTGRPARNAPPPVERLVRGRHIPAHRGGAVRP